MLRRTEADLIARGVARLGGWSFGCKRDEVSKGGIHYLAVVPLQAADFLAYEIYRHMDNRIVEGVKLNRHGNEIPTRRALRNLLQKDNPRYAHLRDSELPTPFYTLFLNKAKIAKMIEMLDANISH